MRKFDISILFNGISVEKETLSIIVHPSKTNPMEIFYNQQIDNIPDRISFKPDRNFCYVWPLAA